MPKMRIDPVVVRRIGCCAAIVAGACIFAIGLTAAYILGGVIGSCQAYGNTSFSEKTAVLNALDDDTRFSEVVIEPTSDGGITIEGVVKSDADREALIERLRVVYEERIRGIVSVSVGDQPE